MTDLSAGSVASDDPSQRADWRLVEGVYGQLSRIISDPSATFLPDAVTGFLAQALGRVSAHYDDEEMVLGDHFLQICSLADERANKLSTTFNELYSDSRLLDGRFPAYTPATGHRRRPPPFEAAIETCRRLRDLSDIRTAFTTHMPSAGILGGSMSYGRFLNVKGARAEGGSDIDLMLVVTDYEQLGDAVACIRDLDQVGDEDVDRMQSRLDRYPVVAKIHAPCIFSHRLPLWSAGDPYLEKHAIPGRYALSIHCFSVDHLDHLLLSDLPVIKFANEANLRRTIYDYRPEAPVESLDHQRSFFGTDLRVTRTFEKVDNGFLAESAVFAMDCERYHPGLYQNLVLPQFELRWDNLPHPIGRKLDAFRWKVVERVREERRRWPYSLLRLSLSHTRSHVLAPHIVRSIDEGVGAQ